MSNLTVKEFRSWYDQHADEDGENYDESFSDPSEFAWATQHAFGGERLTTPWGPVEVVNDVGGEGQGDYMEVVIKVSGIYLRHTGFWASWDGAYWDEGTPWHEVRPVEKTIIEYESVK